MRRNNVNSASGIKTALTIVFSDHDSYKTDALPLPTDVYWIYSMFFATTSHDLVTLTFDLLTLRVLHVSYPTHTPIFIILRLSVTKLRVLNI